MDHGETYLEGNIKVWGNSFLSYCIIWHSFVLFLTAY
jgi:hypothetical protein